MIFVAGGRYSRPYEILERADLIDAHGVGSAADRHRQQLRHGSGLDDGGRAIGVAEAPIS